MSPHPSSPSQAPERDDRRYPERPIVGVGVVLWRDHQVLLIKRGKPPREGRNVGGAGWTSSVWWSCLAAMHRPFDWRALPLASPW